MQYRITPALATFAVALSFAVPASADDVTDAAQDALAAYAEGDLAYAKEMFDFASQLIGQQKAGTLTDMLPDALEGWTAGDAESQAMGAAMFGGGTTASRSYERDGKDVTIQFIADSPMLAQMGAMMTNPAMAGANGGKMIRLGREKAIVSADGSIQMMVANRIMVQVEGSAAAEDKMAYAKAIDLRALKDY